MKTKKLGILAVSFLVGCGSVSSNCPTKDKVEGIVKTFTPQSFTIENISKVNGVKDLCEVVLKVGVRPIVFYIDSNAQYIIAGDLISVQDKKNLTREKQQEYMKVSNDMLKEFEKHVDFTYGQGSRFIYYITDPECPFCKRSEPIIEKWAKKNNVQVKVILFPLPIHPNAFGKSVALVCDKKGWEELVKGYDSKNQCEEGKKKVGENIQFLSQLGIDGTPTFIGMNGKIYSGVPTEDDLNKLVN